MKLGILSVNQLQVFRDNASYYQLQEHLLPVLRFLYSMKQPQVLIREQKKGFRMQ